MSQMVGGGQGVDFSPVGFELLRDACEGMIQAAGHQGLGCGARSRLQTESWELLDLGGGYKTTREDGVTGKGRGGEDTTDCPGGRTFPEEVRGGK